MSCSSLRSFLSDLLVDVDTEEITLHDDNAAGICSPIPTPNEPRFAPCRWKSETNNTRRPLYSTPDDKPLCRWDSSPNKERQPLNSRPPRRPYRRSSTDMSKASVLKTSSEDPKSVCHEIRFPGCGMPTVPRDLDH
ncbi:expressed unknown protein [Seminavis robusta]|uniref:Uncharacterized protein n=1 Tax=Seminavis robusta TaxID=568900 RepID=A0A9N8F141_9STRA|nr:expressed unknown protein [Seminavis robusta]|eukprot:Sro2559_g331271.1  (136) ;mRNA; f:11644-12051